MGITPTTKTAQMVADAVKRQFGDESGAQITETDIIRWINEGQLEIARKNHYNKGTLTTTSVAGQSEYTLPGSQIIGIQALYYKGKPLVTRSFESVQEIILRNEDPTQPSNVGPVLWYEYGDNVYLHPAPTEDGDEIKLFVDEYPVTVAAIGDALSVPDTYFKTLIDFVLKEAYELDDDWRGSQAKSAQVDVSLAELEGNSSATEQYYPSITVMTEDAW